MQRGFTLVETAVTVGIIALLLASAVAFGLGTRPLAMRSALTQFSAQLAAARSLAAASANGATIVVQPGTSGGFTSILYGGRPNRPPLETTTTAPLRSQAGIREVTLGAPAFSIFVSSSGHVSVQGGYPPVSQYDTVAVSALSSEPPCPAAGAYTLVFSANGASDSITLPCQISVSGTPLPTFTNSPTPSPT